MALLDGFPRFSTIRDKSIKGKLVIMWIGKGKILILEKLEDSKENIKNLTKYLPCQKKAPHFSMERF
jgi:hypothetical protein